MGYKLYQKLTKVNYTHMSNKKNEYIVIHYTGNITDLALSNARYFETVNRGASANYFVDSKTVYQCVLDSDKAWHVGVNYEIIHYLVSVQILIQLELKCVLLKEKFQRIRIKTQLN